MGASGWSYWTSYQSDINQVLQGLRGEVFASGNFSAPDDWESADLSDYLFDEVHGDTDAMKKLIEESPIERLRIVAGFEGTHSIIDVFAVEQEPRSNINELDFAVDDLGKVFPVADSELEALFGTTKPLRSQVESSVSDLMDSCERFTGKYVIAYEDGVPREILFVGVSGD